MQVVHCGGISKAAEKLKLSKSTVSTQLKRFEQQLGVKLLSRTSRRISLTREGEYLLPRVESLLAEGERLIEQVEKKVSSPTGTVRMALTPDFGPLVLRACLPLVREQYPELNMIAKFSFDFEDLQDPAFDLAIRIGQVHDEDLIARPLGSFRRILVASPQFLSQYPINQPGDLAAVPCLRFSGSDHRGVWTLYHNTRQQNEQLDIESPISVQSFSLLADLAKQHQGVGYLPDFVVQHAIAIGELVQCLPNWSARPTPVFVVYRPGTERIQRVRSVIELVKQTVPKLLSGAAST